MADDKSSRPEIVTEPLPDLVAPCLLDLVFEMGKLNDAMTRLDTLIDGNPPSDIGQNPPFPER